MAGQVNPRSLVVDVLYAVEREGKFLNQALAEAFGRAGSLSRRDRAFIQRVSVGTIERRIELDYILDQFSDTKVKKMKPVIRAILESGLYQLIYMDSVPDSAVCDEAVELARQRGFSGLSGFVNGVLRNIARHRDQITFPSGQEDPVRALSVRYSMPEWIVARLLHAYGSERCGQILAACLARRPLCVRVDTRRRSPEEVAVSLKAQGIRVSVDPRLSYAFYLEGIDALEEIPEFADGTLYPQDVASMMAVELADPAPGERVLDLCAAPGGKSIQAAQRMDDTGMVCARDRSEAKVEQIRENIRRCRVTNLYAEVWDALIFDPDWEGRADLVLADLPCSGLGVIGHKPDIKYRVTKEDIRTLAAQQRQMLAVAARYVRPGGRLLYSTCTWTNEENRDNTRWFLTQYPAFSLEAERQLMPDEGCDGFYLAKLRLAPEAAQSRPISPETGRE